MFKIKLPSSQPSFYGHIFKAKLSAPLGQSLGFTFVCVEAVVALIIGLFKPGGPFQISWNVSARIINAVQSHLRIWAHWNFIKKCFKIKPLWVEFYSSSAIVFVSRARFTCASLYNVVVCPIEFRSAPLRLVAMFKVHSNGVSIGCALRNGGF